MAMDHDYFFLFTSHFDRDAGLDMGRLSLNSLVRGTYKIWMASSSVSTKQGFESFHVSGGYIPPQYRVPGLAKWMVNLLPIPLEHIKGIEGNFYKIDPHEVQTDRGGKRSDFGIHRDANVPGSMGCIVMSSDRFEQFEKIMARFREAEILTLPLFVQYS